MVFVLPRRRGILQGTVGVFNKTFFNFTIGFMAIVLVAFMVTLVVNFLDNKNATQNALDLEAQQEAAT